MKKVLLSLAAVAMLFSGCAKSLEDRVSVLEEKVASLEEVVAALDIKVNGISSIVSNLQEKVYVTSVDPVKDISGNVTGYTISFTKGEPVTITNGATGPQGPTGVSGLTPTIDMFEGEWYWKYEGGDWILDSNGKKIPAVKPPHFTPVTDPERYRFHQIPVRTFRLDDINNLIAGELEMYRDPTLPPRTEDPIPQEEDAAPQAEPQVSSYGEVISLSTAGGIEAAITAAIEQADRFEELEAAEKEALRKAAEEEAARKAALHTNRQRADLRRASSPASDEECYCQLSQPRADTYNNAADTDIRWYNSLAHSTQRAVPAKEIPHGNNRRGHTDTGVADGGTYGGTVARRHIGNKEIHTHWRPQATARRCCPACKRLHCKEHIVTGNWNKRIQRIAL